MPPCFIALKPQQQQFQQMCLSFKSASSDHAVPSPCHGRQQQKCMLRYTRWRQLVSKDYVAGKEIKKHEGLTTSHSATHLKCSPALLRQKHLLWRRRSGGMAGIHWRRQHGFDRLKWPLPGFGSQPQCRHAGCKEAIKIIRKGGGRVHVCVCVSVFEAWEAEWESLAIVPSQWREKTCVCSCMDAPTR